MSRRIETQASRTAEWACISRAVSYLETRETYKSGDWVAPHLVPSYLQGLVKIGLVRSVLTGVIASRLVTGLYEYVTVRTKYIDGVFQEVLKDGFTQILILGAGFDSRAVRFPVESSHTKVFELDAPHSQRAKLEQYRRRKIAIPPNVVFVPIDFEKQTLSQRLAEAGFQK